VADPSDAARLTGSNLVDVALVLASPWLPVPAKVEEYSHFLSHNKRFVLFAPNNHPHEWIYRK
jgi:hypothetical protein